MSTRVPPSPWLFGALCAGVGFAAGVVAAVGAKGAGWGLALGAAPAAAFLSGAGAWWALVFRGGTCTGFRGAGAGALSGILAHPLCWGLLLVPQGGWTDVRSLPLVVGMMTAVSLLVVGWATALVGAALGFGLASWPRAQHERG